MASSTAHITAAGLLWKDGSDGTLLQGAIQGGYRNTSDKAPYYVGRVLAPDGKYHPAKLFMAGSTLVANYCYNDKEVQSAPKFDVLVVSAADQVKLEWVSANNGKIPAYAVQGERDELYVGRHEANSELVIGEVNAGSGQCLVVTGLQAYKFTEYEVLCAFPHASTA